MPNIEFPNKSKAMNEVLQNGIPTGPDKQIAYGILSFVESGEPFTYMGNLEDLGYESGGYILHKLESQYERFVGFIQSQSNVLFQDERELHGHLVNTLIESLAENRRHAIAAFMFEMTCDFDFDSVLFYPEFINDDLVDATSNFDGINDRDMVMESMETLEGSSVDYGCLVASTLLPSPSKLRATLMQHQFPMYNN